MLRQLTSLIGLSSLSEDVLVVKWLAKYKIQPSQDVTKQE